MDGVRTDRVTAEILHTLDWESLIGNDNFVGLHDFLDCLANVAESDINARRLDAFIRRLLDSLQEWIKHWVERDREGAIDNVTIDLRAEIDLHHVVVVQHGVVTGIGRIVSGTVVYAATSWEPNSLLYPIGLHESPIGVLDSFANVDQFHARLHVRLRHLPHLPVALSCLPQVIYL